MIIFIIASVRSKLAEILWGGCMLYYIVNNIIFYWMYNTYYIVASSLTGRELWSLRDKTMGMMWWWHNLYFFFSSRQFPTLTSLDVYYQLSCYCKQQIDKQFSKCLMYILLQTVEMFKTICLQWNHEQVPLSFKHFYVILMAYDSILAHAKL